MQTRPRNLGPSVIAIAVIAALAALAILVIIIPANGRRPGSHHGPCHQCGAQMRGLALALTLWAQNNKSNLPGADDWVDLLTTQGFAPLEMFTSPHDPIPGHISYTYVPPESNAFTGTGVLLYEPLDLHPDCGVHIAFQDGHVELYPPEEARRIIESGSPQSDAP